MLFLIELLIIGISCLPVASIAVMLTRTGLTRTRTRTRHGRTRTRTRPQGPDLKDQDT